jgi:predicted nucleotide-binding protein
MHDHEHLFDLAAKLIDAAATGEKPEIAVAVEAIERAANEINRSFSGSWIGYHSRVYYAGFNPPPPGHHFSKEWGFTGEKWLGHGSHGDWIEFGVDDIRKAVQEHAGNPDLSEAKRVEKAAAQVFNSAKLEILSILTTEVDQRKDQFLEKLIDDLAEMAPMSKREVVELWGPKGKWMTRDATAAGQGIVTPTHIELLAEVVSIRQTFSICTTAAEIASKAASHLERKAMKKQVNARIGTNVFFGHGRSAAWRELKDFVQDRLRLPCDDFNRVPVAGITNIARLSEMLDGAAVALLVMTAEDEMADGAVQARMNVVHEAGLFQGRLGFTKAIVMLEDGCQEFSNIHGLGQIRFPAGKISASFEEVRQVLEREGLIQP